MIKKLVGDRNFYKMVMAITLPIILQNGITNFVSLLDNIMVGRLSPAEFSAVAVSNQLFFVYNLCLFGAVSGAGIFTSQFFGKGDDEGIRNTMRMKLIFSAIITAAAIGIVFLFGENLISLWLNDADRAEDLAVTLKEGYKYLRIITVGFIPMMLTQCYSDTLRTTGETVLPMKSGIVALVVNLVLNWFLIFPHEFMPISGLGVAGAAIATVIARFAECAVVVIYTHTHKQKHPFAKGLYKALLVPISLAKQITITGFPLLLNETLFGLGLTFVNQAYSMRGMTVVEAVSVASAIINMFNIVTFAIGTSVGIIIGKTLGSGDLEKARDYDNKMIAFSTFISAAVGLLVIAVAPLMASFYDITPETRELSIILMRITAAFLPLRGFLNSTYFTLRSGGKTGITFIFDAGYVWCVLVLVSFIIARFTEIPIIPFFVIVQALDLIKASVGFILVKKGVWLKNIVEKEEEKEAVSKAI